MDWEKLLLSAFPVFFAGFWLGILHFCAWLGGWTTLARQFKDDGVRDDGRRDDQLQADNSFRDNTFPTNKPIRRAWLQSEALA
jgi:hypothetical protein